MSSPVPSSFTQDSYFPGVHGEDNTFPVLASLELNTHSWHCRLRQRPLIMWQSWGGLSSNIVNSLCGLVFSIPMSLWSDLHCRDLVSRTEMLLSTPGDSVVNFIWGCTVLSCLYSLSIFVYFTILLTSSTSFPHGQGMVHSGLNASSPKYSM